MGPHTIGVGDGVEDTVGAGVLAVVASFREAFSASSRASRVSQSVASEHPTTNKSGINKRSNRFTPQIVGVRGQALLPLIPMFGDCSYTKSLGEMVTLCPKWKGQGIDW